MRGMATDPGTTLYQRYQPWRRSVEIGFWVLNYLVGALANTVTVNMDVRRLGLLRERAQRGTVTAVAEAMHLTPSAVSQQLKALEREAGVPLTQRSGRGLALTPPGRILADAARDVGVAIERAEAVWAEFV